MSSHASIPWCQELMRDRTFKNPNGTVTIHPPVLKTKYQKTRSAAKYLCAGCALGKLNQRPTKSSTTRNTSEMDLKVNKLAPGDRVFTDQYDLSDPGRRYDTYK